MSIRDCARSCSTPSAPCATTGTTFLVIEHDMELAQDICDRIIVMDAGKIVAQGSFEEISHDPHVMEAYLGVSAE